MLSSGIRVHCRCDVCTFYSVAVCCSVLQCVAVCCGVLQCVAVCCSVLQCVAVCCSVLQCVAVCCNVNAHANAMVFVRTAVPAAGSTVLTMNRGAQKD